MLLKNPLDRAADLPLWRYMDFAKFVGFLQTKSLYFPRADKFSDQYEGMWSKATIEAKKLELAQWEAEGRKIKGGAKGAFNDWLNVTRQMRTEIAISCWSQDEHESAALWKLYMKSDHGVAIKTRLPILMTQIEPHPELTMDPYKIEYLDYDQEAIPSGNYLNPYLYKRKSFAFENEVRVIAAFGGTEETESSFHTWITMEDFKDGGISVPVRNPSELVKEVFVAPTSEAWFQKAVQGLCKSEGLQLEVRRSALEENPWS